MQWWTLKQLRSKSPRTRVQALRRIRESDDTRPLAAVRDCLSDAEDQVSIEAAHTLGSFKDAESVSHLTRSLPHPEAAVRKAIVEALSQIDH